MGCGSSVSEDFDGIVKSGNLSPSCFDEQRALGKGGFGTVIAVCKKFGGKSERDKFYAMKRLDKRRIVDCWGMDVMLMAELHYMTDITNDRSPAEGDFLMQLECAFQDKFHVYIVQNLMEGGDVFHLMKKRNSPLSVTEVQWFAACTCLALQQLHGHHNILHRDIKEENLLIDSRGYAHLADFGLCDKMDEKGECHAFGGTMAYMSPESRDAASKRTQRATHDFFAVGVMVFRMLCFDFPFDCSHNFNTVVAMHINDHKKKNLAEIESDELNHMRGEEILLEASEMPQRYRVATTLLKEKVKNEDAINFILELLIFKEDLRLGKKKGVLELMEHPFLKGMDWASMRKKTATPPYVPNPNDMSTIMRNDLDLLETFRADGEEDRITDEQQKIFEDFYYNPWFEEVRNTNTAMTSGKSSIDHHKVRALREKHLEQHLAKVEKSASKITFTGGIAAETIEEASGEVEDGVVGTMRAVRRATLNAVGGSMRRASNSSSPTMTAATRPLDPKDSPPPLGKSRKEVLREQLEEG